MSIEIVTSGRDLTASSAAQLEHEPHAPSFAPCNRTHAIRPR
jgi:hypothetical protein